MILAYMFWLFQLHVQVFINLVLICPRRSPTNRVEVAIVDYD